MKKYIKTTLLSAFVFPGAGHLYLKHYIPGIILISTTGAGVFYVIYTLIQTALSIVDKIQTGAVPPDITAISQLLLNRSDASESFLFNMATIVVMICWIIGIIDSYRIARRQDQQHD